MWKTKIAKSSLMILLMVTTAMAGCIGSDDDSTSSTDNCSGDELKIAYEIKEDLIGSSWIVALMIIPVSPIPPHVA